MTCTCRNCGYVFNVGHYLMPECPRCVRGRMAFAGGITPKHTRPGALASVAAGHYASYIADGVDPADILDHIEHGVHVCTADFVGPSGCQVYFSPRHVSFNAVAWRPQGLIPGSGIGPAGHYAAEVAVLADLAGQSRHGPHFFFMTVPGVHDRVCRGDYVPLPMCHACGTNPVYWLGTLCEVCRRPSR